MARVHLSLCVNGRMESCVSSGEHWYQVASVELP